jgi:hypothetical protein
MTPKPTFDYDRFVGQYRAACARRGIDPAHGATGYQVVHVTAEQRRTARQPDRWWQQHEFWLNCPPYHSDTEQDAIWSLFAQSYAVMAARLTQAVRLYRAQRAAQLSLRELHRRQRGGGRSA